MFYLQRFPIHISWEFKQFSFFGKVLIYSSNKYNNWVFFRSAPGIFFIYRTDFTSSVQIKKAFNIVLWFPVKPTSSNKLEIEFNILKLTSTFLVRWSRFTNVPEYQNSEKLTYFNFLCIGLSCQNFRCSRSLNKKKQASEVF